MEKKKLCSFVNNFFTRIVQFIGWIQWRADTRHTHASRGKTFFRLYKLKNRTLWCLSLKQCCNRIFYGAIWQKKWHYYIKNFVFILNWITFTSYLYLHHFFFFLMKNRKLHLPLYLTIKNKFARNMNSN